MNLYRKVGLLLAWVVAFLLTISCLSAQSTEKNTSTAFFIARDSLLIRQMTCQRTSFIDLDETINTAYRRFKDSLTTAQLVVLTDHADACVRAYAFAALVDKDYDDIEGILSKHLTDTVSIGYPLMDDVIWSSQIIQFMLSKAPLDKATYMRYASKLYRIKIPDIEVDPSEIKEDSIR